MEQKWEQIRQAIASAPGYDEVLDAMQKAGCALETGDIGISEELKLSGLRYHPYMRNRLSLMRLMNMIELD